MMIIRMLSIALQTFLKYIKKNLGEKMKRYSKLSYAILIISILIIAYILINSHLEKKKPVPCPDYCKEVSKQISDLDLEEFKYIKSENEGEEGIYFRFKSEDNYKPLYDNTDCLDDIVKIKNTISVYLSSHKNQILHEKNIRLAFFGKTGYKIELYNYEKYGSTPEELFAYYDDMYIPPEYFADFTEAKRIGISITDNDDLSGLSNFTDLKELDIYSEIEISQDTIDKVVENLPYCEVNYRDKKYGRIPN